jgi:hypothetical protein
MQKENRAMKNTVEIFARDGQWVADFSDTEFAKHLTSGLSTIWGAGIIPLFDAPSIPAVVVRRNLQAKCPQLHVRIAERARETR